MLDWNSRFYVYRRVAEYLQQSREPNDVVASPEVGVIGYYSDRPILDLFGFVSLTVTRASAMAALRTTKPAYTVNVPFPSYREVKVFPVPARGGVAGSSAVRAFRRVNPTISNSPRAEPG